MIDMSTIISPSNHYNAVLNDKVSNYNSEMNHEQDDSITELNRNSKPPR